MNREIKFRIWDGGIMKRFLRIPVYIASDGTPYKDNNPYGLDMSGKRSISPLTNVILMQSTGLKDKKGVEIFEGDILKDSSGHLWLIQWNDYHACFQVVSPANSVVIEVIDNGNMVVVGNSFEHPELLKK